MRRRPSPSETWQRAELDARRRAWEEKLALHIRAWGLPEPEREYRFHPTRRWRFDFAWPTFMVAAEVEGVSPAGGRHQHIAGFEADAEKYNAATLAGWKVLRFTQSGVRLGEAIRHIEHALHRASEEKGGV